MIIVNVISITIIIIVIIMISSMIIIIIIIIINIICISSIIIITIIIISIYIYIYVHLRRALLDHVLDAQGVQAVLHCEAQEGPQIELAEVHPAHLGVTQTGSYQIGSYQKGRFIRPKPKISYLLFFDTYDLSLYMLYILYTCNILSIYMSICIYIL